MSELEVISHLFTFKKELAILWPTFFIPLTGRLSGKTKYGEKFFLSYIYFASA
jgi:hypothetical protein